MKHGSDKEDLFVMEAKSILLNEKFIDKTFVSIVVYLDVKIFTVTSDS